MPFGVVSGVGRALRDGCIRRGGDRRRGRGNFGGECGHPIVTNGTLWRSYSRPTLLTPKRHPDPISRFATVHPLFRPTGYNTRAWRRVCIKIRWRLIVNDVADNLELCVVTVRIYCSLFSSFARHRTRHYGTAA